MRTTVTRSLWLRAAVLALLALAGSATASASEPGANACQDPTQPGQYLLTLQSGGLERTYGLHIPVGYDGRHRVPLVLSLHGSQGSAIVQTQTTGLEATADRYGFVVATPQGASPQAPGFRWNVPGVTAPFPGETLPDDDAFLSDLVRHLEHAHCADPERVYGTGYSGGARLISQYACDHPDVLAAIAPVAGLRAGLPHATPSGPAPDPATCAPAVGVPVRAFHGTADPLNPFAGGSGSYWQYGALAALARWAEIDRCTRGPIDRQVTEHVTLASYAGCRANATVEMYVIAGGGHTWPGAEGFLPYVPALGTVTFEIDANELMWAFFRSHRHMPAQAGA